MIFVCYPGIDTYKMWGCDKFIELHSELFKEYSDFLKAAKYISEQGYIVLIKYTKFLGQQLKALNTDYEYIIPDGKTLRYQYRNSWFNELLEKFKNNYTPDIYSALYTWHTWANDLDEIYKDNAHKIELKSINDDYVSLIKERINQFTQKSNNPLENGDRFDSLLEDPTP
jgi:hypothetical protein